MRESLLTISVTVVDAHPLETTEVDALFRTSQPKIVAQSCITWVVVGKMEEVTEHRDAVSV